MAKVRDDAPMDKICLFGCAVSYGHRRRAEHREAASRARRWPSSAWVAIGLSVVQGAVMAGADRIIGVDMNPDKFVLAEQLGATEFR